LSRDRTVGSVHPVADRERRRVRAERAHPADRAAAGHDRELERVGPRAAEDFVRVREDRSDRDVDDDLAGAERGIRHVGDAQWLAATRATTTRRCGSSCSCLLDPDDLRSAGGAGRSTVMSRFRRVGRARSRKASGARLLAVG
jgi:hypothetical protein